MLKKTFFKNKSTCKVVFDLEKAVEAELGERIFRAALVGDFNGWDQGATLMKKMKSGIWRVTLELDKEKEYQFRYLINGTIWQNDWKADKYVPNSVDGDNSVVETYPSQEEPSA
jgi:1,4-alpha-glucan branching enzyme